MVEGTPQPDTLVVRALTRVPNLPHWVETRDLLLSGRAGGIRYGNRRVGTRDGGSAARTLIRHV